jgi:tripartite-type tricarboxylate transporter receptor subunit TctC
MKLPIFSIAAALVVASPVYAQQYPTKPVRVIVPFAPGGGSDISARQFSQKLSEALGQQFVVDNRGGAGGLIGLELTAKAPTVPAKNVKELITLARNTKGGMSYASTGIGGITHLATELLSTMAKIKMVHIPYKGTGAAMADLLSGQVPFIVGSLLPVVPHISSGKLRPLAVTTAKRWYTLPNVPTVAETLPGYEVELWFGAFTPKGTPQPIIDRLNGAINKVIEAPDVKKSLEKEGMVPTGGPPQRFNERVRRDYERWLKVVQAANLKPE